MFPPSWALTLPILQCDRRSTRNANLKGNKGFYRFNATPAHEKCSAHLIRQPLPPLREIYSLPFSSQKSLSLSEWPFTMGPFAKCLSPKQSSSNQWKQSGQMIFCNDLLNNSSQFTFLCPESPWGAIQAGGVLTAPLIELQTVITACQPFMSEVCI